MVQSFMDVDEVSLYINKTIAPALKKMMQNKSDHHMHREKNESPFHPTYMRSVSQANAIRPHTDGDHYPKTLFAKLSPNQREDESKWLQDNYEPFTLPIYIDFLNTIKRGANQKNYSIVYPDMPAEYQGDNSLEKYLTGGMPSIGNIHSWFANTCIDNKIKDANGVVAVMPVGNFTKVSDDGSVTIDADAMIEPIPVFYQSKDVLHHSRNAFIGVSADKSVVNKTERTGYVIDIYTPEMIYRASQVGLKSDFKFEVSEYYPIDLDYLPAWVIGGLPAYHDGHIYYQSPYYFALAPLNTMLKNKNILEMVNANVAFPYRIMVGEDCDFKGNDGEACMNGLVLVNGELNQCPACGGSGTKRGPSAGGTLIVREVSANDTPNMDRIRFVAPDTAILTWMQGKVKEEELSARSILHLKTTADQATGSDPTATGRLIDQGSMYAFVMPIISDAFDLYENVLIAVCDIRYGGSVQDRPSIIRPVDIDYMTSQDYLNDYTQAIQSDAPPIIVLRAMEKYIRSLFYGADKEKKMWELVLSVDGLAAQTNAEIRLMSGAKLVEPWQPILHVNIFRYINDAIAADADFMNKDLWHQREVLVSMAKQSAEQISSASVQAFMGI